MNSPRPLFLLPWAAVVLLSSPACIQVPDIEPAKAEVRITSPEEVAYTNGVLEVRLSVTGHVPDRVELLQDGELLAEVEAPYTFAWDTAGVAEGTHQLVARAVFGEVVFASAAREVVVDRTPPQVVSRTPEPGAQDVWVKSPIQAVFSEPVKASTLNEASVRLTVGTVEVARTVSLSADERTVTVEPTTAVVAPDLLTLAMTDGVTDLAGNKASMPSGDWAWAVPEFVPYPLHSSKPIEPLYGREVHLRLNKSGNPVVLVREFDGQSVNLFVSRWTGAAWENLGGGLKKSPANFEVNSPSIQIAPDDNPIVAWQEGVGIEFDNHIYVARWTGTTWERLGGDQGILPNRPHALGVSLALTQNGQPVVAFNMDYEDAYSGGHVLVYRWNQTEWEPVGSSVYGDASASASTPVLALDANDNPTVAFRQQDWKKIHAWRWTNNNWHNLASPVNPRKDFHSIEAVSLILARNGQPITFWVDRNTNTGKQGLLASAWNGSEWISLDAPSSTGSVGTANPATCLDSNEDLLAAWYEIDDTKSTIRAYRRTAEAWIQVWNSDKAFSNDGLYISHPSMDADTRGNIALAWTARRSGQQEIVTYRMNR